LSRRGICRIHLSFDFGSAKQVSVGNGLNVRSSRSHNGGADTRRWQRGRGRCVAIEKQPRELHELSGDGNDKKYGENLRQRSRRTIQPLLWRQVFEGAQTR